MIKRRTFTLSDATAMLPLISRVVKDIRGERSRLAKLARRLERADLSRADRELLQSERRRSRRLLTDHLAEANGLGVEITNGVRCEALFPFEHKWTGSHGDQRLRDAYFVYQDAQGTIREWYFSGWPNQRHLVPQRWQQVPRTVPAKRPATRDAHRAMELRPAA
ncbi:hypothetical protein Pan216_24110 [Planctomycetes bacterium Pan216]|uniref:DUF2203 domain-containing protein n=1 Tax=Kolteria novifilia TaxID=2527975 RepID=A0A518B3I3_9BACT|nr:hypothetical protein Pan216_24110 [Planctomycetes bacterium Pan216]